MNSSDAIHHQGSQVTEITFEAGTFKLSGVLVLPEGVGPHPAVIFIHGDGPHSHDPGGFYKPIWDRFVEVGYACLSWDKPGVGESTGTFSGSRLFRDRASIALAGADFLNCREDIDSGQIGLWGISQAGYVMPLAVSQTDCISFMIAVSCPGMNSIEQSAYLIEKQLVAQGLADYEAKRHSEYYVRRRTAKTYEEYLKYARPLDAQTYISSKLGWGGIVSEDQFVPLGPGDESFFNPVTILQKVTFPVLAFYREKDTQIPTEASAEAYRCALAKAGNDRLRIVVLPDADHLMCVTETGSLEELNTKTPSDYAPGYLDTMADWLIEVLRD